MKTNRKKRPIFVAQVEQPADTQPNHPIFRAYTMGRLPFPDAVDFYGMPYSDAWLFEREADLREELDSMGKELSEALAELKLLRMPLDCHADEKAVALLLSIGKGRFVQDVFEGLQTAMFDMVQRQDTDEKWTLSAKLTVTLDKHDSNKAHIQGETKVGIPAVVTAGSIFMDGAGNMLTPAEAVKQLSIFQYGNKAA